MKWTVIAPAAMLLAACGSSDSGSTGQSAQIRIVGSSTVYPFSKAVAEDFQRSGGGNAIVESTGTGAGMKLFCAGVGAGHPDIENASRRMKASEFEMCQKNGVTDIVEMQIGYDGLAIAQSQAGTPMKLTLAQIYQALAATPFGKPQTAQKWSDIDPSLPDTTIAVFGPPSTSGTRDSLTELILEKGCDTDPAMKALKESDADKHKEICTKVREDGKYVDSGENDNLIVQKLAANPNSVGVFGYSFLEENFDSLRGIALNGVDPAYDTIASGKYPGARAMFIYVKKPHVTAIPGLKEYMSAYVNAWEPGGPLTKRGLIASVDDERKAAAASAANLTLLNGADLK